ncbi:DMT family transporter [Pseudoalteromonas pernae]|uniref:DMT family transporter n=1 Tax=Pseudoalteromonas pernae TaxID=3118054 RepID=UPI003242C1AE
MPASLCLIIATFLWGSSFISLKYAVGAYDPTIVIFLRMLTTLAVSLCLWRFVKRFEYQKGDWKYLVGMSLAEPCLYFLFEGHAMEYTSASQAGVIVSCLPLIIAVLAFFMLKEHISRAIIVGFTLCIGGSILLTAVSPSSEQAPNPLLGNTLEFLAMMCAAFYTISVKHLSARYAPLTLIALQGLAGSLFFSPFLLFVDMPQEHDPIAFAHILYLGTFVTLGGYGMYNYAISKVSVLTAAAYSNLIPIFTLLLSAIVLSEVLTLWQWLSIAVVFVGVMVSQRHQAVVVDMEEDDINLDADTNKRKSVPATGELKG